MKKLFVCLLILILLVGCSSSTPQNTSTSNTSSEPSTQMEVKGEIIYSKVTSWKNSIGSIWISYIGEYTNTGTEPLYLSSSDVDIEDSSGKLIETMQMVSVYPEVILPGESAFYYNTTTVDEKLPDGELIAIEHIKPVAAKIDQILFPVSDIEVKDEKYGGIEVVGRVENNTEEDEGLLYVVALVRDKEGNPLCALMTITDVAAGDKKGFETSGFGMQDDIKANMVGEFIVYAYPLQFQF